MTKSPASNDPAAAAWLIRDHGAARRCLAHRSAPHGQEAACTRQSSQRQNLLEEPPRPPHGGAPSRPHARSQPLISVMAHVCGRSGRVPSGWRNRRAASNLLHPARRTQGVSRCGREGASSAGTGSDLVLVWSGGGRPCHPTKYVSTTKGTGRADT